MNRTSGRGRPGSPVRFLVARAGVARRVVALVAVTRVVALVALVALVAFVAVSSLGSPAFAQAGSAPAAAAPAPPASQPALPGLESAGAVARPASFDCAALYSSGDYPAAAGCFASLEAQGNHNGHILYNLGNAWYRAGEIGRAVHAYRRAQLYLPRDGDLRANLVSARELTKDDLPPPDVRGPIGRALLAPYDARSAGELLLLGAIAWFLALVLGIARLLRPVGGLAATATVLGLLAVLGLGGYIARSWQIARAPLAVVLDDELTLRSGRDLQSVDLARLHEGAELAVVEERGAWLQVRVSNGQRGWLPASGLGLVRLTPQTPKSD